MSLNPLETFTVIGSCHCSFLKTQHLEHRTFCKRSLSIIYMLIVCVQCTAHRAHHRDRYLEQQQTEKIESELRVGDRIRITKVYASCPGWPSGGHKSPPVKHKHVLFPPACSSPLITEALPGSWPGRYMRMDSS
jgi:hypothetical protein